jgi:hypothetical protein
MPPSSVHFNGSVNLPDAETVMREISSRVPAGVRRMTDGETGERNYWILFQIQKFLAMPEFEAVSSGQAYETAPDAPAMPQLRLTGGASADTIKWPDLGYAAAYGESFEVFRGLQAEGTIPDGVRFQLQYPTPLASIAGTIVPEDLPRVAPSYEAALFADLDRALAVLPHDRCAVQWDVAVEFGLLEGGFDPSVKASVEDLTPGLARAVDHVPQDVPVGCISVMATTAISISSSPSRSRCRWRSRTLSSPRHRGRSTSFRSPCRRPGARRGSSPHFATFEPEPRPSCTSPWCPITPPTSRRAPRPSR